MTQVPPVVMAFSGLDPTGGAGLQADIEAIASMGCHTTPVASCLTVQTTTDVLGVIPIDATLIIEQARAVLEDMPVHAFKIGLLPNVETVETIATILSDYPSIPVIVDPVLSAGGGAALANESTTEALLELIVPLTTIMTPNSNEATALIRGGDTLDAAAMGLLSHGCDYVLVTGTHRKTPQVTNTLYGDSRKIKAYNWDRLEGEYHGSGCTLASSIAALIAHGQTPVSAVEAAQKYTWQALKNATRLGMGQQIPNRLFWVSESET